jgi:hypothetical protein
MAESLVFAVLVEIGLRALSFARLLGWLDAIRPARLLAASCPSERLGRFSAAAYRVLPVEPTCLRESLVLFALLRRRGASPTLCLGVSREGAALSAHAWIECAHPQRSIVDLSSAAASRSDGNSAL